VLELDHLVVACLDLDDGEAWLRERLGAPLSPGGKHPGWGTHNRLLQLGGGVYLELIAPDPSAPEPASPRPFMLDDDGLRRRLRRAPELVHWLVRADDLERELGGLRYLCGTIVPMTRGALRWRITIPPGGRPPADGLLPTLIQWDVPMSEHPTARLPDAGVRLAGLTVRGPKEVVERRPHVVAPVPIEWVDSRADPGLSLALDTPRGRVVLGG
jgi:hypothetical protein